MPLIAPNRRPEAEARLAEALSHLKRSGDDVQFIGYVEFLLSAGMLLAHLRLAEGITNRESEELVSRTLIAMCRAGEHMLEQFEARLKKGQTEKLKLPKKTFHLLASIRAKRHFLAENEDYLVTKVDGVQVRLAKDFPKKAKVEALKVGEQKIDLRGSLPYVPVWATVKARGELEAADRCMSAIKATLGCVNLMLNHNTQRHHSGRRLPKNQVRLIGDQVVFRADWSCYQDYFFYEDESEHPERWPPDLDEGLKVRRENLLEALAKLNDRVFGKMLIEAMQDYHEALSHIDSALVHVRLWGLLERLTNTHLEETKVTVRRATFLSTRTDLRRTRLRHAAEARHAFVHRRLRAPFIDSVAEDLRHWAEEMLLYIFFSKRKFRDVDFFFRLLDAPKTAKEIERAMSVLRVAKDHLG